MKEFGIYNVKTKEEKIVFGYSLKDALDRYGLDSAEWATWHCEYLD